MTIQSPEFAALLQDYLTAPSSERDAPLEKLVHFIDVYVTVRRTQAVNAFKAQCRAQRLILVKGEGFAQLLSDLDRLPDGDTADHARSLKTDALDAPDDDDTPEFTIKEDDDLDRLLNSTAALLSGQANMDVGLAWTSDLEAVLSRLNETRK